MVGARKLFEKPLAQQFGIVVIASLVMLFAARSLLHRVVCLDAEVVEDFYQVETRLGRKLVVGGGNHYVHFGVVHCANALSVTKLFWRRTKRLFCKYTQKIGINHTLFLQYLNVVGFVNVICRNNTCYTFYNIMKLCYRKRFFAKDVLNSK